MSEFQKPFSDHARDDYDRIFYSEKTEQFDGNTKLFDADPDCKHVIVYSAFGIRCVKCNGWSCY
jgi:hypothetical protein